MEKFRIGVIGLKFGALHVQTLANMDDVRLVAVASRAPKAGGNLDAYAAGYGARAYRDGIALMEQEKLDAISLAVSPRWREALVEYAAQHQIPMFIEKPWASNLEQARRLAAICQRHNATVMVGFSFRFLPVIVRLQELIHAELGQGRMLNGQYVFDYLPPADHWLWNAENGNGYFNENSCHLFDVVRSILGQPISVMAEGANFSGSPSEEAGTMSLRFGNGAIAALTVGGIGVKAFKSFPHLEIFTENGQAQVSGREHIWETLTWAVRNAPETRTLTTAPEWVGNTRYTAAFRHFIECVKTGRKPTATVEDGIAAVALAQAAYESARTGRKVQLESMLTDNGENYL